MMETLGSMIGMYKEEEVDISSKKLISLNESNELVLDNIKEIRDSYVISIIGDARKGKSTFLNCMINYLTRKNKEYFKVESTLKHCTIGMDYLSIEVEDKKYLFVDCQGLNYENSSNDYKYLLFLYSISNVIIYNEMGIVNNGIFATLQSMPMFVKNFDGFTKDCSLYIRVADYDYEEDVELLKDILFSDEEDQFDNVRKSIKKLFNEEIYITETCSLDRKEKELLRKNMYNSILDIETIGFKNSIERIYDILEDTKELINVDLESLVNSINNNKKISFDKLDIYTATTNLEIKKYVEENFYENELYSDWVFHSEIKIPYKFDGLNETRELYDNILDETEKIKNKFNGIYSTVPDTIKMEFIIKYNEILDVVIECVEKNREIGIKDGNVFYVKFETSIKKNIYKHFDMYNPNKMNYDNDIYNKFIKRISVIDYDAREILENRAKNLIDEINNKIDEIYSYNMVVIEKINSDLCEIKYDISELISNKTDYNGDYEKFIEENNPYNLISENYKYKKFDKNGDVIEYTSLIDFNKISEEYYDNYVTESYKYYDMFDNKNKELLKDKYFVKNELKYFEGYDILEEDCLIESDNIYYVKFVLCENVFGEFKDTCVMELTTFMNMFDEKEKKIILNVIEDIVEDNVINLCLDNMKLSNKLIERLMLDLQVKIMNNETFVKYTKDFDVVKKRFNL